MRSIATYPLAALCGLAMIGALFLKWFRVPDEITGVLSGLTENLTAELGGDVAALIPQVQTSFGPVDLLDIEGFSLEMVLQDPVGIAVVFALLMAAAVAILGFLGGMVPRLFAILAGIAPFGAVGYGFFQLRDQAAGLPIDLSGLGNGDLSLTERFDTVAPYIGMGLYVFFGAAFLLLLLGLFSPSKAAAY